MTPKRSIGKNFRSVWLSVMVSSAGDGMFLTAFPLLAAILTRDPVLIAGVTIASRLPWLMFSMFTGALADRMDRRKLMIGADLIRLVIVGLLGIAILTDLVNIWMLYLSAFFLGTCETLHVNAAQGLIPAIVKQEDLLEANARFASGQIVAAQFIGPPLGVAMFNVSMSLPFLADAATFAGSAALVSRVPDEHAVEPPTTKILSDIKEGIRYTIETLSLRRLTEILTVVNFFYFAANSLLVLYNEDLLGGNKITFTALSVGAASGTVISRLFLDKITTRLGKSRTLEVSLWAWAFATIGLAVAWEPILAIVMHLVLGIGSGWWIALNTTLRQQITPTRMLGRMNAVSRTVTWGIVPFGALFGGVAARVFGLRGPFIISAVVMTGYALFAKRLLKPVEHDISRLDIRA
ncbi:MAG: MFS transporter [Ilumatobacteraceae bacterium]